MSHNNIGISVFDSLLESLNPSSWFFVIMIPLLKLDEFCQNTTGRNHYIYLLKFKSGYVRNICPSKLVILQKTC